MRQILLQLVNAVGIIYLCELGAFWQRFHKTLWHPPNWPRWKKSMKKSPPTKVHFKKTLSKIPVGRVFLIKIQRFSNIVVASWKVSCRVIGIGIKARNIEKTRLGNGSFLKSCKTTSPTSIYLLHSILRILQ